MIPIHQQGKGNWLPCAHLLWTFSQELSLGTGMCLSWTFLGEIQACTALPTCSNKPQQVTGGGSPTAPAFGKRDFVGMKPWLVLFLRCPMGNQISTLQRKESEVTLISNTLCIDCYQAFQKYLNFLLGSNFCFL